MLEHHHFIPATTISLIFCSIFGYFLTEGLNNNNKKKKIDAAQKAQLLAASSPHSGDWLLALPVASCGLRLDDEAVRVAVSLRLGLNLGAPHTCRCCAEVDARGLHGLVCKRASSRIARHQQLNDLVSAGVPAIKEPVGLTRRDGKRPDGVTQILLQAGKLMAWDVK